MDGLALVMVIVERTPGRIERCRRLPVIAGYSMTKPAARVKACTYAEDDFDGCRHVDSMDRDGF